MLLNHFLTKDRLAGFLHQLVQVIQKLRGYLVQDFLGDIVDIHVYSSFVFFKKSYCYYLTLSFLGVKSGSFCQKTLSHKEKPDTSASGLSPQKGNFIKL